MSATLPIGISKAPMDSTYDSATQPSMTADRLNSDPICGRAMFTDEAMNVDRNPLVAVTTRVMVCWERSIPVMLPAGRGAQRE